ncbi:MAG TPA: hypothetical protein VFS15_19730 [Kofleriaceae bacterium]|nr:hypothetical protein [Kofleriaceae bacterium]
MRWLLAMTALAACGDNLAPTGSFEVVGHADLGARGMNAAIAIAGDIAYVGSRIDNQPVLIVDIADPENPHVVGELGLPDEGLPSMSSRELRATTDPPMLFVLNLVCSPSLHGCQSGGGEIENIKQYDISNPLAPRLVGLRGIVGERLKTRSPHEFFLWQDPADKTRVLLHVSAPGVPSLVVLQASDTGPAPVLEYDPYVEGGVVRGGENNLLHSVAASDDGRTLYLSHQTAGLYIADIGDIVDRVDPPAVTMMTTADAAVKFGVMGPHSAVPVPGRDLLVTTEEVYPPPYGTGCPWGHVRLVDIADPAAPALRGEYKLPENDPSCTADGPMVAFTAHNATATTNLALVTWYAGGLQAIDISDPNEPFGLAEFRPEPLASVAVEDPGLGGSKVEMWSYPIIKDGLIYVVDSRNGLYALRYHGRWGEEIAYRAFLEGNSNLGANTSSE